VTASVLKKLPESALSITALRRQAEARLRELEGLRPPQPDVPRSVADSRRLVHELQVHQVELEMQNAELRQARDNLEVALENYTDLYDFAPVGYFTLAVDGSIQFVNLTGANLVGMERTRLVGRSLAQLFTPEWRPAFRAFLKQVFASHAKQSGDFELLRPGQPPLNVNLEAQHFADRPECRAVMIDITERKQAEGAQRRMEVLGGANLKLRREIIRRQAVEASLKQSQQQQSRLLAQSRQAQAQARFLSRKVLRAQEEERKRISRELHDVIAQTLTTINVRLAALKKDASLNVHGIDRSIARTQRMVEKSVNVVHAFARELRPAVLDDLGLIPALHSFVKQFSKRTRILVHLKVFAGIERMDNTKRTVLYRVAQEALANVARHAKAGRVEVNIEKLDHSARMEIKDDGKSFEVLRALNSRGNRRLGLLGMRERVDMVGGTFGVESAPGQGTIVRVEIPFARRAGKSARKISGRSKLKRT